MPAVFADAFNHVGPGWELAQGLGALAAVCCLLLCALPVRPRARGLRSLPLRRHETLGWLALAAAVTHVALLPLVDRSVVEHLKSSAPLYEWAGILALGLLFALTLPAIEAVRRRLWARHRNFQALHVGMTCLLLTLLTAHVVTTNRYLHGRVRAIVYVMLSAGVLLSLLRPRANPVQPRAPTSFLHTLVFGRHAALVLALVLGSALILFAPLSRAIVLALREPLVKRSTALPIEFPHEKHRAVDCVVCHHNFVDRTGEGGCYDCHRNSPAITLELEARFHDFCLDCHRDPPRALKHHGPVTGCDTCHAEPANTRS
jgi:hypothetical protein